MKITLNWLRQFVDVTLAPDALCDVLVMAGLEVESVEQQRPVWRTVEVAEIVEVVPHPNADRLRLCTVANRARAPVRVVCGADNMRPGDRVAWAPPGTLLPGGRRIERATIRGQASEGMLCSATELDLPEEPGGGILILPADAHVGTALVEYLTADDSVLDLAPTPNRGDCLSVLGVAREVAALTRARLRVPRVALVESEPVAGRLAQVAVEAPDLCPRYCARIVRGVTLGAAPLWMRLRLALVGIRPINNVVDATNYVMIERGQPLHAFDLARVEGAAVTARRAGSAQRFTTLDGREHDLVPDDLVIADTRGPIALAGIMGGANSEIRPETTDILLESAFFAPHTVRRTARRLGLSSESSYRFERGVDPMGTAAALDRMTELIGASAGGTIARGILEKRAAAIRRRPVVRLRPAHLNALLGTRLGVGDVTRALRALGAEVTGDGRPTVRVVPPPHRFDLQSEIDLVEEVARLRGYDTIAATTPRIALGGPGPEDHAQVEERLRDALRAGGLSEMVTLAFVASEENRIFPGLADLTGETVSLVNPQSSDAAELRRSLLPGLLRALAHNLRQAEPLVAGFVLGRVYARQGAHYDERRRLGILLAGEWPAATIGEAPRLAAFADLKGALDLALGRLHVEDVRWEPTAGGPAYLHPGKGACITVSGVACGVAGALHPALADRRDLPHEVWLAELDMTKVVQYCPRRVSFRPLPRFPAVVRDVAVVVDTEFRAQQILDAIREIAEPLVEEVRVFDHYAGAPIPEGKKSLAYSIAYRAPDRTLTDDEVNALHGRIVDGLVQHLPVEVRR